MFSRNRIMQPLKVWLPFGHLLELLNIGIIPNRYGFIRQSQFNSTFGCDICSSCRANSFGIGIISGYSFTKHGSRTSRRSRPLPRNSVNSLTANLSYVFWKNIRASDPSYTEQWTDLVALPAGAVIGVVKHKDSAIFQLAPPRIMRIGKN